MKFERGMRRAGIALGSLSALHFFLINFGRLLAEGTDPRISYDLTYVALLALTVLVGSGLVFAVARLSFVGISRVGAGLLNPPTDQE